MKLGQLLVEIEKSLAASDTASETRVALAQAASDLADMVGWSGGPIDPERRLTARFEALSERLRSRHTQSGDVSLAALHGALIELQAAIDRHDRDLATTRGDEDDDEP